MVVTPLSPDCTEDLLCKFNILPDWEHIVYGLHHSFNMGVNNNPSKLHIFHKSLFLKPRLILHQLIYQGGAVSKLLLQGFLTRGAWVNYWTIPNLTTWPSSQTALTQTVHDPRYVLPMQWPHSTLCQCQNWLWPVPNRMGNIQQNCGHCPFPTSRLHSSHIQYLCCLPPDTHLTQPEKCSVHILERKSLCRLCCHVQFIIQHWSIWYCCRYAGSHLLNSRIWHPHEVGRWLSSHLAAWSDMDRGRFHFPNQKHWSPMEPCQNQTFCLSSTIHWIWLESCFQICNITGRETQVNSTSGILLVHGRSHFLSIQSSVTTWKTSTCIQHFHPHPPFPAFDCALCDLIHHPRTHLHPPTYVCANLSWINFLLQASPYSSPLFTSDPIDINWWGDASSSFGIGVVVSQF